MTKKKSSDSRQCSSGSPITLTQVAFWSLVMVAIAWVTATIFGAVPWNSTKVAEFFLQFAGYLRSVAIALMAVVVCFKAYPHIRNRSVGWHVLYWVCVLLVILTIIAGVIWQW